METAYPGNKLDCEFSKAPPLVGAIKKRNVLTTKHRDASLSWGSMAAWPARSQQESYREAKEISRFRSSSAILMGEAGKGWVATPHPIAEDIIRSAPLSPRFSIEEQHGGATKKKIRLVDDFKRSEVNSIIKLHDASPPIYPRRHVRNGSGICPIVAHCSPHARNNGFRSRVQTHRCGK